LSSAVSCQTLSGLHTGHQPVISDLLVDRLKICVPSRKRLRHNLLRIEIFSVCGLQSTDFLLELLVRPVLFKLAYPVIKFFHTGFNRVGPLRRTLRIRSRLIRDLLCFGP